MYWPRKNPSPIGPCLGFDWYPYGYVNCPGYSSLAPGQILSPVPLSPPWQASAGVEIGDRGIRVGDERELNPAVAVLAVLGLAAGAYFYNREQERRTKCDPAVQNVPEGKWLAADGRLTPDAEQALLEFYATQYLEGVRDPDQMAADGLDQLSQAPGECQEPRVLWGDELDKVREAQGLAAGLLAMTASELTWRKYEEPLILLPQGPATETWLSSPHASGLEEADPHKFRYLLQFQPVLEGFGFWMVFDYTIDADAEPAGAPEDVQEEIGRAFQKEGGNRFDMSVAYGRADAVAAVGGKVRGGDALRAAAEEWLKTRPTPEPQPEEESDEGVQVAGERVPNPSPLIGAALIGAGGGAIALDERNRRITQACRPAVHLDPTQSWLDDKGELTYHSQELLKVPLELYYLEGSTKTNRQLAEGAIKEISGNANCKFPVLMWGELLHVVNKATAFTESYMAQLRRQQNPAEFYDAVVVGKEAVCYMAETNLDAIRDRARYLHEALDEYAPDVPGWVADNMAGAVHDLAGVRRSLIKGPSARETPPAPAGNYMVRPQAWRIMQDVDRIKHDGGENLRDLQDWAEAKISSARRSLEDAADYLEYKADGGAA